MNKKYTHIFFDLDNTLWDFNTNSRYAMESAFNILNLEKKGIDFSVFFETYEKHNHQLWDLYRKKEVIKKDLIRLRFQLPFDELGISGIDAYEMNDVYLSEMPKQTRLIPGAKELVEKLSLQNYILSIITNGFREVQNKKIISSGLSPFFKKVFVSEDVKTPKPGREIFEHALKSTNAKKKSSLMIGDDWGVDIIGALNFGIDAVYYSSEVVKENNTDIFKRNNVHVINNLLQLFPLL